MNQNELKKSAANKAVEFVESGMVLGLGTGSTTNFAVERIGELLNVGKLINIVGIPTSIRTAELAESLGIKLVTLDSHPKIDLTIDGADEVDDDLNLIKGGGGALFREKIVAEASERVVIIIDESKLSTKLGVKWAVPVEVVPFAVKPVEKYIFDMGADIRLRKNEDDSLYVTDNGNNILDCNFGPIDDPDEISNLLNQKAGIVEHGLFINIATDIIIADENGIGHLKR